MILFFLFQPAYSSQNDSVSLEEIFTGIKQTEVKYDGAVLVVDQAVKKLEYKVGETITVTPMLVNMGNKNVTIVYYMPLFLTDVKDLNGSTVWPPHPTGIVPIPTIKTLLPNMHITVTDGIQNTSPLILNSAGKYSITSIAYFKINSNDEKQPFHVVWSKPLEITVSQEIFEDINKLPPLKQFKSGIPAQHVQCREGLQLIMKVSNGHPVCATSSTASRLLQTGWAEPAIITEEGWVDRSK